MKNIPIVIDAILANTLVNHWHELTPSMLKKLSKSVDFNLIPDRVIVNNEDVRRIVDWDSMDKMKLIRVFIRCIDVGTDIADEIKPHLDGHQYKIKNIIHLLGRRPHYIEYFPIDLNKLKTIEAASLLSIGETYFLNKIDLSNYRFNFKESMNIIQGYNYRRDIIEQVNYKALKGYQIAEILIESGERDLDILSTSKMTNIDWINLLERRPEMLKYCDYSKFNRGDIYYSIRLCCMFETPDLSHLVLDRDISEITPFGWEKLLIEKPGKFLAFCNFEKLDDNNWSNILEVHPQLHVHKD